MCSSIQDNTAFQVVFRAKSMHIRYNKKINFKNNGTSPVPIRTQDTYSHTSW